MPRIPLALANWKMAMTVAESLEFVQNFRALTGDLVDDVDVILCPPFTALWPLARALDENHVQVGGRDVSQSPDTTRSTQRASHHPELVEAPSPLSASRISIQLGAQNMASVADPARTGQISAALLTNVSCDWVMLGHWEVRRHLGDDDALVNRKVRLALETGLRPILFVGEARDDAAPLVEVLEGHLARALNGCAAEQVARMAFIYEPEGAIGVDQPTSPEHIADACTFIRTWLRREWGEAAAERARIVYGGSAGPDSAGDLLAYPGLDGLAVTRRGRDPAAFAEIVRLIAQARQSG